MTNLTLKQAYDLFIFDRETFCSPKTIVYYQKNIGFFIDYVRIFDVMLLSELSSIPENVLSRYVHHLRDKVRFSNHPFAVKDDDIKIKNTTIRTYSRAVKAFLNFCNLEYGTSFITKVRMPKDDSDEKVPLYNDEVKQIDKLFNLKTETGLRNYCLFHLMLDAGLRAEEVQALLVSHIFFDKNIIKIVDSKGNKSRIVILAPKLKKYLFTYLTLYCGYRIGSSSHQFVFKKMRGDGAINYNCIKMVFTRIKKASGITRLTPHLLRHTFATSYIMGGGNIESLRLLLGHYDYSVTRTYLHLANSLALMKADIYKLDSSFFNFGY